MGMTPSASRVAGRFAPKRAPDLGTFWDRFAQRDAISFLHGDAERITGPMMAEVAWEIGYEGDPYESTLGEFEALGRKMKVNLRAEYEAGAKAR